MYSIISRDKCVIGRQRSTTIVTGEVYGAVVTGDQVVASVQSGENDGKAGAGYAARRCIDTKMANRPRIYSHTGAASNEGKDGICHGNSLIAC